MRYRNVEQAGFSSRWGYTRDEGLAVFGEGEGEEELLHCGSESALG